MFHRYRILPTGPLLGSDMRLGSDPDAYTISVCCRQWNSRDVPHKETTAHDGLYRDCSRMRLHNSRQRQSLCLACSTHSPGLQKV